jgi:hypothetical protein
VVYTIENGNQELYLDGTKIEDSNHTASIVYGNEPLYIGASTAGTRFFNGSIDDVRIYNGTLSPDEVKYLHEIGRR